MEKGLLEENKTFILATISATFSRFDSWQSEQSDLFFDYFGAIWIVEYPLIEAREYTNMRTQFL